MKKVFLDTNFIIDYLLRPEYLRLSLQVLAIRDLKFYISYLTVANFAYIARKLPRPELYAKISTLCDVFNVTVNNSTQIQKALEIESNDFEDILQYQTAKASGCQFIITRNAKDYTFSDIPVYSPQEFLNLQSI